MATNTIKTAVLGYPRIGEKRELKKATESFWKGEISKNDLLATGRDIRKKNWNLQKSLGIDIIPSNDFSLYDQVLDMSCLLGNVPARFKWDGADINLETLFLMARGPRESGADKVDATACEMTKWFDTNYHYIVPEFTSQTKFKLSAAKVFDEFKEALESGIKTRPILIGPVTYLTLGKVHDEKNPDFNRFTLLDKVLPVYIEVLKKLASLGAEWAQIDEPIFALDLTDEQKQALKKSYAKIKESVPSLKVIITTYFGDLRDNLETFLSLPVEGFHIDCVRAGNDLEGVLSKFPKGKALSLGVVDGRNIWKNDHEKSLKFLKRAQEKLGNALLIVASSCSLIHSPNTLRNENELDEELKSWLSFAEEKLREIKDLADILAGKADKSVLEKNKKALQSRRESKRIHNQAVKKRLSAVKTKDLQRKSSFVKRKRVQHEKLNLPLFPTTTIGSFPQTVEVRAMRAKLKKGDITQKQYEKYMEDEIKNAIKVQDEIDIDMYVHGEFERNDMVEYFGEQLDGFAFTQNGWVQSYGSRYVKPPFIYGDVSRPQPMTVRWSKFAQSLTKKPMKGMLTGPVTISQWSFVRDDQPREATVKQIALAIRDEVVDLERAGIAAIQIDEPAIREGLPLRRSDWNDYLKWAVDSFRLSSSGVKDETQIHTHMCYSEFNDIIKSIAAMDADVISIETSRSKMELLDAFVNFKYPNEIGPGVYDIHSPRVPTKKEIDELLDKAEEVLPVENIWVNPDCGLKTRQWDEVIPSLKNMVESAKTMREKVGATR
ncbi:MAG TPA: 5-methyltetrahydropteroyltriglutamate--homocysteine S-methyltransferase [Candidatus Omnitrophota bacterium]|nr:5-methyltetrahydropteroyltriglutamate--homocysteine S-methyltransferase [Candidatus Omnitrophota bacterium]